VERERGGEREGGKGREEGGRRRNGKGKWGEGIASLALGGIDSPARLALETRPLLKPWPVF